MQFSLFFSFRFYSVFSDKKRSAARSGPRNLRVGCRTGTSFIADKITHRKPMRNPYFQIFQYPRSPIFTGFPGPILLMLVRCFLGAESARKNFSKKQKIAQTHLPATLFTFSFIIFPDLLDQFILLLCLRENSPVIKRCEYHIGYGERTP